jgi:hypothetical protein
MALSSTRLFSANLIGDSVHTALPASAKSPSPESPAHPPRETPHHAALSCLVHVEQLVCLLLQVDLPGTSGQQVLEALAQQPQAVLPAVQGWGRDCKDGGS